ncbi:MAG: CPBP family intramembrane metalloprotease [Anaerolineales bacterium]|nr:MAG: CPBP family intramembrane metalloprotease [Anaerolineales bacterium]
MEETTETTHTTSEIRPGTWRDLFLYIFGGFGLYVIGSILVSLPFEEIDLVVVTLGILMNVLFVGGGAYIFGVRRGKITWASLGISPPVWKNIYFVWAFFLVIGLMPIRIIIGFIVQYLMEGGIESLQYRADLFAVSLDSWYGFLILLVGVGVLAPISEELYFRGLLYNWFRQRTGVGLSVSLSSLLFGIAHFDSIGVAASAFVMGVVIALVYERTKSLWIAIAMHVITNSISVALIFIVDLV